MRMIDADALIEDIKRSFWDGDSFCGYTPVTWLKQIFEDIGKQPTVGGWVSVKDRLPDVGEKCFIRDKTDVTVGRLIDKEHWIWQWEDSDFYGRGGITHWRPLPKSPEVE